MPSISIGQTNSPEFRNTTDSIVSPQNQQLPAQRVFRQMVQICSRIYCGPSKCSLPRQESQPGSETLESQLGREKNSFEQEAKLVSLKTSTVP